MNKFLTEGVPEDIVSKNEVRNNEEILKDYETCPSITPDFVVDFKEKIDGSHYLFINCFLITKDLTKLISAGSDSVIKIWDIKSLKIIATLRGHLKSVSCLAISEKKQETLFSAD